MTALGLGIVGLGMALPPHARALADLRDQIHVVAAWSPSAERRQAAAAAYALPEAASLDALLADPAVEAILVLTPPHVHAELAERAFAAGKHVLVEKPLDVSLERAAAMVAQAAAAGSILGVVLQHRYREATRTLQAMLRAGELGTIQAASCTVPWWRDQAYYDAPGRGTRARDGGGVLMTQAIHALDVFRALTGGVARVAASARTTALHRMECEDHVAATMTLTGGGIASLVASTATFPGYPEEIRLIGTRGVATLSGGALHIAGLDGQSFELAVAAPSGGGAEPMAFSHEAHRALLLDFAQAVRAHRNPLVDGVEALRTQRLIEAILAAAASGAWQDVPPD
ncbi:MAG: gfo/Idh/MocA family oxidoreductase [Geminicoccaceae bacterium]|nr:MAG: gfo/Idh/MocA family oxidoreductase [Geminicoccaceae bacterium]